MSSKSAQTPFFYECSRILLNYYFDAFYTFTVQGNQQVPKDGSIIFASNHLSFYDPPIVGLSIERPLNYFARDSLFKGFLGIIIRGLNAIPVNRTASDIKSLKAIFTVLKNNGAIVVFPEGTRSSDGKLQEPKPGIGMIACKSNATVVPTRIFGTFEAFGRHKKIPTLGTPIHISFGPPVSANSIDPGAKHPERYLEFSRRIMKEIAKLELPEQVIV